MPKNKVSIPLFIAKSYFFSRKINKSINIISLISLLGVCVATAALIMVLSIYNGLDQIIKSYYDDYNPDLVIKPRTGKFMDASSAFLEDIKSTPGVTAVSKVLSENCLVEYEAKQHVAQVIGVDSNYTKTVGLDYLIVTGDQELYSPSQRAVIGANLAYRLSFNVNFLAMLKVYFPRKDVKYSLTNTKKLLNHDYIKASSVYRLSNEEKSNSLYVPFGFLQELLGADQSRLSWIALKIQDKEHIHLVQERLQNQLGDNYRVLNKFQQEEELYKLLQVEKLGIFLILSFLIIISSFSIVSAVIMLIINKRQDVKILHYLGMTDQQIKRIFFLNSVFIILGGALSGLLLGSLLCFLQEKFHLLKANGLMIDYYPVNLVFMDVLWVIVAVVGISVSISIIPVRFLSKKLLGGKGF